MDNLNSNNKKVILIRKASGEEEAFSSEKLKKSLHNAGAKNETIEKIVTNIKNWVYPGVSTKKIYARAFSILRDEKSDSSLRYRLKQAILELGPTGYPFEILIGKLFDHMGFKTEVGIVIDGNCVTHEMDVIATKDKIQHLVECKYHKDQGKQVSVQVPLYVHSRIEDITSKRNTLLEYKDFSFKGWVITNTRLSSDSIKYGNCCGLNLLAWNYPFGNGLKENIEKFKLYPITILSNLKTKEIKYLLNEGIVTCSQLIEKSDSLSNLGLSKKKYKLLTKEINQICG